jgi:hypothetical protein
MQVAQIPRLQERHFFGHETHSPLSSSSPLEQDVHVRISSGAQVEQDTMQLRQTPPVSANPTLQARQVVPLVQEIQLRWHDSQLSPSKNWPGGHSRQLVADPEHETQAESQEEQIVPER